MPQTPHMRLKVKVDEEKLENLDIAIADFNALSVELDRAVYRVRSAIRELADALNVEKVEES